MCVSGSGSLLIHPSRLGCDINYSGWTFFLTQDEPLLARSELPSQQHFATSDDWGGRAPVHVPGSMLSPGKMLHGREIKEGKEGKSLCDCSPDYLKSMQ